MKQHKLPTYQQLKSYYSNEKIGNKQYNRLAKELISEQALNLQNHTQRNKNTKHINYKIYHLLHRPFTFVNSYAKISKNKAALSKGYKDSQIIEYFGICKAESIANKFKSNSYIWSPVGLTRIPKSRNNTKRPINTPTQEDRICQEALRGILESIYEPEFVEFEKHTNYRSTNYGFRPNKSTWDAISTLKTKGQSTNYAIEGDICSAYNSINQKKLIQILSKRIQDKKLLQIIKNLLKSGVMEKKTFEHSLSGTPQGGIIRPLLFNIYMFEFDKYIYNQIIKPIYEENIPLGRTKQIDKHKPTNKKDQTEKNIQKHLVIQRLKTNHSLPETKPRNAVYTRYADHWVLLLNGTKDQVIEIREKIYKFINKQLFLTVDLEKIKITQTKNGFNFLGFTYKMRTNCKITRTIYNKTRVLKTTTSRSTIIYPDKNKIFEKNLILGKYCKKKNNTYYPIGSGKLALLSTYKIIIHYQQRMIGLYNYYKNTNNLEAINFAFYILKYSCAKTIARRKKISMTKIFKLYGPNLETFIIVYKKEKSIKKVIQLPTLSSLKTEQFKTDVLPLPKDDPFNGIKFWPTSMKLY